MFLRKFDDGLFFERFDALSDEQIRLYLGMRRVAIQLMKLGPKANANMGERSYVPRPGDLRDATVLLDMGFIEVGPAAETSGEAISRELTLLTREVDS